MGGDIYPYGPGFKKSVVFFVGRLVGFLSATIIEVGRGTCSFWSTKPCPDASWDGIIYPHERSRMANNSWGQIFPWIIWAWDVFCFFSNFCFLIPCYSQVIPNVSNDKNPGWLFDIGDYTTQLYGDYNKPI